MNARRLTLVTLAWLCATVGIALAGAPAQAAIIHEFLPEPTKKLSEGVPAEGPHKELVPSPGLLGGPHEMAIDGGHLWMAEAERVDEFDASNGAFESQLAKPASLKSFSRKIAIRDETAELPETELYFTAENEQNENVVAVLDSSGGLQATWTGADTPSKSFTCPGGCSTIADIAVDSSKSISDWAAGDIYVAIASASEPGDDVVDVFKPEAGGKEKYVAQLPGPEAGGRFSASGGRSLAVEPSSGDVIVAESEGAHERALYIFEPTSVVGQYALVRKLTGTPEGAFKSGPIVTVDGGNGDFYLFESEREPGIVYQLNEEGVYIGRLTDTPTGVFGSIRSLAVDPSSHEVYISDIEAEREGALVNVFGPSLVIPDVASGAPANVKVSSATLNGTVDPDKEGEATCQFVWGTSTEFGQATTCSAPVPAGSTATPVQASLSGLEPDTTYYYRLQGTNKNGTNPGEESQDQQFTTPGVGIQEESVSNVASTSVTLQATLDPDNSPTTYYFQYGTTTNYSSYAPAPPGTSIGSGKGGVEVAQHVQGLLADTLYHYRAVAVSEPQAGAFEEFDGPDETFTSQGANESVLPDGRAWEMVSPPEKHGALIEPIGQPELSAGGVIQAAAAGNAFSYRTNAPTEAQPAGYSNSVQVLSARAPDGWSSRDIASPHVTSTIASVGNGGEYRFFSEDLSLAILQPFGSFIPASSPQALAPQESSEQTAYLRTVDQGGDVNDPCLSGCYRPLVTGAPGYANVSPGTVFGMATENGKLCPPFPICGPDFRGATPDASHVVLGSPAGPLIAGGTPGSLYEWSGGKLALVSVLPENEGGTATESVLGVAKDARHAISDDGSHVFWTRDPNPRLYMRDMAKGETIRLDVVQGGTGSGQVHPEFQTASSDGSRVFFTDSQELTRTDSARSVDLYECRIVEVTGKLRCVLSDLASNVLGAVPGVSEDGSWVYFVSNSVLAQGAVHGTCEASSLPTASCNLYVRHDGETKLVTVLSWADEKDWERTLTDMTSRVSPNGEWLAFMSQQDLTGYVTRDAISGQPDEEVYLYSADAKKLVCASCNPTGGRPVGSEYGEGDEARHLLYGGDGVWGSKTWLAANVPAWTSYQSSTSLYQSRYLSDSGRLFFNSHDGLVPQDVNGTWDVYEYEPLGVGDCSTAVATFSGRSQGCAGLVSSGSSAEESAFMDASGTGGDVFFMTTAKLVAQDFDTSLDVYDAHECSSSSPCLKPVAAQPPPCSTGDSCKPAPTPQPAIFGSPSSATFSGVGNVIPAQAGPVAALKPKSLTRAQKLARELKVCAKKRKRSKRVACERLARKRNGKAHKTKRSKRRNK